MNNSAPVPAVMSVAGSDPSGGAGIQQDMRVFSITGCYGMACVTAITVQNSLTVQSVTPVGNENVSRQMQAAIQDHVPVAMKTGMLADAATVRSVAALIPEDTALVVDPVMLSTSGATLLDRSGRHEMLNSLFPQAVIITPNIPEAEEIAGITIKDIAGMKAAAVRIAEESGSRSRQPALLIKGGHLNGENKTDILYCNKKFHYFNHKQAEKSGVHGTGCLLSAAITSFMAIGNPIEDAVAKAIDFTVKAIDNAFKTDTGGFAAYPLFP